MGGSEVCNPLEGCCWVGSSAMSISAYFYWIFFALQSGLVIKHLKRNLCLRARVTTALICLALSTFCHGLWFTLRACHFDLEFENFLNRFGHLLLFTGFTVYLTTWATFLHSAMGNRQVGQLFNTDFTPSPLTSNLSQQGAATDRAYN
jgi:hypothetical protein